MIRFYWTFIFVFHFMLGFSQVEQNTLPEQESQNDTDYFGLLIQAQDYYKNGDTVNAIILIDKAIKKEPKISAGYNQRGHLKFKMHDYHGAIEDFSIYIELSKGISLTIGYLLRGEAKYMAGDKEGARQDFDTSFNYNISNGHLFYKLGKAYKKLDDDEQACKCFKLGKKHKDSDAKKA